MKKQIMSIAGCVSLLLAIASCGGEAKNSVSSTPIDSTNLTGEAPVQYGGVNPANPDSPRYEGAHDTGKRANTMSGEDSIKAGLKK